MKLFLPSFLFHTGTPHGEDELDKVITYTKSVVVREDLIDTILGRIKHTSSLDYTQRTKTYVQVYLLLEDFIITNKPLVIQKLYSRNSLREEIRQKIDLQKLPEEFRLLFLPEKEQLFLICTLYTGALSRYIINQVGISALQTIVSSATAESPFAGLRIDDEKAMANLYQHLPDVSPAELLRLFQKVNIALFDTISSSFGWQTAFELTQKHYLHIKDIYNYDLISLYLQAIPPGVLDKERVAYMTREDLEKQALIAAEEKIRREMAEKSANALQEEKAIVEEKVREQTAVINQEKEELKKAVEKINSNFLQAQRNEAKLLASVKGMSLGFILTDTGDNIIASNEPAKRILGFAEEIRTVSDVTTQLDNKLDLPGLITACKEKKISNELKEFETENQILHISITPVFLTEPQEEYIGTVILIDDVTEEKRLERTKDEFFAIASHELRTPLTAIRGSVSILKNYYPDNVSEGDIPNLINYIDQSSVRLIEIVNEFLNVSRLEQGRIMFKNELFQLQDLASTVVHELKNLAETKKISVEFKQNSTLQQKVFADKDKAKQILFNLIGNAIKFTDSGGISVEVIEKDENVCVRITDTGTGIPPEYQRLLFRKFQQADENILTHDASKGTGLGLYISKKLAENMGGMVYLEWSERGKGSTFTFSLPFAKQ